MLSTGKTKWAGVCLTGGSHCWRRGGAAAGMQLENADTPDMRLLSPL